MTTDPPVEAAQQQYLRHHLSLNVLVNALINMQEYGLLSNDINKFQAEYTLSEFELQLKFVKPVALNDLNDYFVLFGVGVGLSVSVYCLEMLVSHLMVKKLKRILKVKLWEAVLSKMFSWGRREARRLFRPDDESAAMNDDGVLSSSTFHL